MQKGGYRPEKDATKTINNGEMLSMLKYGAQEIISTAQIDITEESIENILDRSLRKTEEL